MPPLPPVAALPLAPVAASTPLAAAAAAPAAPAPAAATAPTAGTATGTAPAPPSPPPTRCAGLAFPYLIAVGGGPSIGFDSGARASVGSSARLKAPAESAAVAAAWAARRRARKRRQQQTHKYDYADATMKYDVVPNGGRARRRAGHFNEPSIGHRGGATRLRRYGRERRRAGDGIGHTACRRLRWWTEHVMLPHTWTPEEGQDKP